MPVHSKNQKRSLFLLMLALVIMSSCQKKAPKTMPPPEIQVVLVQQSNVPIHADLIGQVYGLYDIPIRARVEGWLNGIYFKEGSRVEKDKLLYRIDGETYEANVAAQLGGLAEAETQLVKALSDLDRVVPLAKINAVSQSDLDAANAAAGAAKAAVDAAKANLEAANIQLSYTKVYSPIDGIIGKTQAKVGEFVGRDPNPVILNTVSRIDTILVQFFISENQYLMLTKEFITETKKYPTTKKPEGVKKDLELILSDGSTFNEKGWVNFIDREIDPTTGSIMIQSVFPNPERLLRPGQFARVRAVLREVPDALLIPQRCVMELQGLYSVFVADSGNVITSRQVEVGPTIGSQWLINSGLKPGEKVVYEGLQAVKQGMKITPKIIDPNQTATEKTDSDGK
ncbi:MAG: efflux RND transporter periplasmic adaptor subunit [Bacteroidetes bacterium]|nr:efflux RND transporter periplasmic adaptor subunit [Bacteroidota bacterium]